VTAAAGHQVAHVTPWIWRFILMALIAGLALIKRRRSGKSTGGGSSRRAAGLVDDRTREAGILATLQAERASVAASGHQIEVESTPIRYVLSEKAIRWLIARSAAVLRPVGNRMTAGASAAINHRLKPHLVRSYLR
jgi:hypothetical protein